MSIVSLAVIKLSLITLFGFFLYRNKVVNEKILTFLTFFVITITVPFLIFAHLIENAEVILNSSLWIFIVLSLCLFLGGWSLGSIFSIKSAGPFRREFISLTSFQNAGYLPMNIALFLFTPEMRKDFLVYVFLYLLGYNILMWSLGSFFIFKHRKEKFRLRSLFTPPVLSTIIALMLVYTKLTRFVPEVITTPMAMIGQMSFVLSMIVLGCWLAKVKLESVSANMLLLGKAALLKLIVLPFLFLIVTASFKLFSLMGLFIVLQAAMPSAASLPIIANLRSADSEFTSQGVFVSHILSIITIPLWMGSYLAISGFSF